MSASKKNILHGRSLSGVQPYDTSGESTYVSDDGDQPYDGIEEIKDGFIMLNDTSQFTQVELSTAYGNLLRYLNIIPEEEVLEASNLLNLFPGINITDINKLGENDPEYMLFDAGTEANKIKFSSFTTLYIGTRGGKRMIMKEYAKSLENTIQARRTAMSVAERFFLEKTKDIPGMPKYEFIDERGDLLAMELLNGSSLDVLIKRMEEEDNNDLASMLSIMTRIAAAVEELHRRGISHLDIKPSNIFVRKDGQIIFLDFQISKSMGTDGKEVLAGRFQKNAIIGTLRFMSPEQVYTRDIDSSSDIFSLGIMFYEFLTQGCHPFRSSGSKQDYRLACHRNNVNTANLQINDVPLPLQDLVLSMLKKEPSSRPSATDVREVLSSFSDIRDTLEALDREIERVSSPQSAEGIQNLIGNFISEIEAECGIGETQNGKDNKAV